MIVRQHLQPIREVSEEVLTLDRDQVVVRFVCWRVGEVV
jgi:hypothetical protein